VTIKPFAIGVYELTEAEWQVCVTDGACKTKPKSGEEPNLPALYLSWRDANDYAAWLSKKSGRKYRLPTEAEWEYAARGGATTAYWWGDSFDRARVSSNAAGVVGAFSANAFGLYDVAANAREWVADCYVNNFAKAPVDGSAVTDGDCGKRVIRGGAWLSAPVDMRVANRSRIDIGVRARYMGVRLAAEIE
jgi:formylglycine-generating enzyme required for sulfatase activity